MARAFETVTPVEGARLREAGAQVVDVRETIEWRRGRVPGAVHIPVLAVGRRAPEELDTRRAVVVLCASGHRSTVAARTLAKHGFAQVYDVHGGLSAWRREGLPFET